MQNDKITIIQPDDWHLHVRDGDVLKTVLPYTAHTFGRAIIMPNLKNPVTTAAKAREYRERIMASVPGGVAFTPLMTCYLTDDTDADDVKRGFSSGDLTAAKLYPKGATTNSENGVTDIRNIYPVLGTMEQIGMPLLVHGEVTDSDVDIFDREAVFIDRVLTPLLNDFAALKIVFEHITTKDAVDFVRAETDHLAATVTPHHLLINRNALFKGGLNPHMYCLPVAKRERHRRALRDVVSGGHPRFFLGTDSAPHMISAKETGCGCAGIFSAFSALELYASVFDEEDALDNLEAFASLNGPRFYGLDVNENKVTLARKPLAVPDEIPVQGGESIKPFMAGETLLWSVTDND